MSRQRVSARLVIGGVLAAVALTALSLVAIAAGGTSHHSYFTSRTTTCSAPALDGTVIDVSLMNMGSSMMGGNGGMMNGAAMNNGMMRLMVSRSTAPAGTVSFRAFNGGSVVHELVVLPLSGNQVVGTRSIGSDARVDEAGSLGEVSNSCAAGAGDGIAPGSVGWTTLNLPAGRYELVCNLPGHYAAGMYAQLVVQ